MSDLPKGPGLHLSMHFCGTMPSGESLLVITDEYSRYPVCEIVRDTSVKSIIPIVDKVFATFSYPEVLKTDNGPQCRSELWKKFMASCGVKHRRITPLWPKANSQAESFNKPLEKAIRAAHVEHRSWKQELHKFCRMYRATPHCTTHFTPHFLLFNREPKTKLPELSQHTHTADTQVRSTDTAAKLKMKMDAYKRHHARPCNIQPGDTVLVKQPKQNKLSTNFNPTPLQVTHTKGSMITVQRPDGSSLTRNSSLFRHLPPSVKPAPAVVPEYIIPTSNENPSQIPLMAPNTDIVPIDTGPRGVDASDVIQSPVRAPTRRSNRESKAPAYLKDYVV